MGIGDNLSSSFGYAKDGLVGQWVRWILLIICAIIQGITIYIVPLLNGYVVRILGGAQAAPDVDQWGKLFVDGWKLNIIGIVYMIIPFIVALVIFMLSAGAGVGVLDLFQVTSGADIGMFLATLGIAFIIFVILAIIFGLFAIIGAVRFARKGELGAAFQFSEIAAHIGKIGWGHYIVALIVLWVVFVIIAAILSMIPFIGMILLIIIEPLLVIWGARYYSNLYDAGV
ncbi:MAG: DUF4013 domain-containing protein [Methanospirillaceae archaeon]|nr:DUF4013 domain-containing protein [Methanospirillaceae archaeon]